jgi:hypothetical protein
MAMEQEINAAAAIRVDDPCMAAKAMSTWLVGAVPSTARP